jgi:hypothetical protein
MDEEKTIINFGGYPVGMGLIVVLITQIFFLYLLLSSGETDLLILLPVTLIFFSLLTSFNYINKIIYEDDKFIFKGLYRTFEIIGIKTIEFRKITGQVIFLIIKTNKNQTRRFWYLYFKTDHKKFIDLLIQLDLSYIDI